MKERFMVVEIFQNGCLIDKHNMQTTKDSKIDEFIDELLKSGNGNTSIRIEFFNVRRVKK